MRWHAHTKEPHAHVPDLPERRPAGGPLSTPADLIPPQVLEALRRGNALEAIKLLRASGNFGLREAKELLDAHRRGETVARPAKPRPANIAPPGVADAMKQGNKIEAIRLLREQTGMGLKEAKDAIDLQAHVRATPGGLSPGQVPDSSVGRWVTIAILVAAVIALVYFLAGCAAVPQAPVAKLAPSGKLRAAINFGNPILAVKDASTGEARGVSVDLARELGKRLGVPVELVTFTAAGKVVEAVKDAQVDIAFVAIDPVRGADMLQTTPYVIIEGAYLVRNDSPIRRNEEVDRAGNRIVVGNGSAYDLFLTRELKAARLVKAPTSPAVTDLFVAQNLEVAAGVKQQLQADAKRLPGLRLLDGRFMVIQQAMGLPRGREAGKQYVEAFVEEMKASGFVAQALARHGIEGAAVAPPGR